MIGSGAALGVSASLSVLQGTASVLQANSGYPDLPPDGIARKNLLRYRVAVDPSQPCGGLLSLALTVTYTGGEVTFYLPEIVTALPLQSVQTFSLRRPASATSGQGYRYGSAVPVLAPVVVGDNSPIEYLTVALDISHTFVGDLILNLIAPNGDVLVLASRLGGAGDNYTMVTFDDAAARTIATSSGPFSGSYRPQQPLSTFNGRIPAGTWNLQVSDNAPNDAGTINAFSLTITHAVCTAHTVVLSPVFK